MDHKTVYVMYFTGLILVINSLDNSTDTVYDPILHWIDTLDNSIDATKLFVTSYIICRSAKPKLR
jgi:hypothetical protein